MKNEKKKTYMEGLVKIDMIKKFMQDNNLTRKEFANMCKMSESTLYRILDGKHNFDLRYILYISITMKVQMYQLFNSKRP